MGFFLFKTDSFNRIGFFMHQCYKLGDIGCQVMKDRKILHFFKSQAKKYYKYSLTGHKKQKIL